ncbi:MAG TPA: aminotransferase class V-fold PLP-dependent enzyme [Chloroflexota bacterium]|jgi:L-seryl-tRNA(Ser) seleniumtransferase
MSSSPTASSVFEQLGVKPVINARGNNTVLGGSTPSPRVRRAMLDMERSYVDMQDLLERSGQAIADMLGCEAAYVTPGAAAALALASAACMAGADIDRIQRLPDTSGMRSAILIQSGHRYHYDRAVTVPGARLREVESDQLEAALQADDVAAVLFPAHLDGAAGTLSLVRVIELAHARGVLVIVDAAGRVYPLERFKSYTRLGADLVAFGAKYLGALNASGILCGRRDLVAAAAIDGFMGFETSAWGKSWGRPLKVDRQTIVAVVTALREWLDTDHDARLAGYERRLKAMASELEGAPGVKLSITQDEGPAPRVLRVEVDPAQARMDATGLAQALWAGTPAIAVNRDGNSAVLINPVTLLEEDDGTVVSRLGNMLL